MTFGRRSTQDTLSGPNERHRRSQVLHAELLPAATAKAERLGKVYLAPLDVHLPTGDVVQPDVLFIRERNLEIIQDWIRGVPDLVVEVVSKTHAERDRIVKFGVYERAGVPEYWLVDPGARSVEIHRLDDDAYRPDGYLVGSGVVRSPLLPGIEVDVGLTFG